MTLRKLLRYISDEEQRIALTIDKGDETEYTYLSFWLSDFRSNCTTAVNCKDYIVTGFSVSYGGVLNIEIKKV